MKLTNWLIIIAIVLAIISRFVWLDHAPPHLSNDEISIAYDAYSIAHLGRDQHNQFLPLAFQSYGDYKAPLAEYLTVPSVLVFGNTEFAARFPSAFFGSLTILVLGLLLFQWTRQLSLALLGILVLAITPWHVYTSRMLLETNIALFFVVLGVWLFYRGLEHRPVWLLGSFISFSLSIYAYHTEKGFTPLLIILLLVLNRRHWKNRRLVYSGLVLFVLLVTPALINILATLGTHARASTELIYKDPQLALQLQSTASPLIQAQLVAAKFLSNYSAYTNPQWLFFNGLELLPFTDPFQVGLFLAPMLPLCFIGLFKLKHYLQHFANLVYGWLILGPLIPALTIGQASIFRDLVTIIPLVVCTAVGLQYVLEKIPLWGRVVVWVILGLSFGFFWSIYCVYFPVAKAQNFQYGYRQIADFLNQHPSNQTIVVDPRFGKGNIYTGVPQMYLSYFTRLSPSQLTGSQIVNGSLTFGRYQITDLDWLHQAVLPNTLYIVPATNQPTADNLDKLELVQQIKLPQDVLPTFLIYQSR